MTQHQNQTFRKKELSLSAFMSDSGAYLLGRSPKDHTNLRAMERGPQLPGGSRPSFGHQ
jgi:hypothetical protein